MSKLYLYEGYFEKGEKGNLRIQEAGALYLGEKGISVKPENLTVLREEKGKPYFAGREAEFSLSHSGALWMCLMGDKPCGLDLQIIKESNWEKISEKYFGPLERHYAELWGAEGFFAIWVRKEAFGKCTGQGFLSDMPEMVGVDMEFTQELVWGGVTYYMDNIEIAPDIQCAVCRQENTEIEMRLIG